MKYNSSIALKVFFLLTSFFIHYLCIDCYADQTIMIVGGISVKADNQENSSQVKMFGNVEFGNTTGDFWALKLGQNSEVLIDIGQQSIVEITIGSSQEVNLVTADNIQYPIATTSLNIEANTLDAIIEINGAMKIMNMINPVSGDYTTLEGNFIIDLDQLTMTGDSITLYDPFWDEDLINANFNFNLLQPSEYRYIEITANLDKELNFSENISISTDSNIIIKLLPSEAYYEVTYDSGLLIINVPALEGVSINIRPPISGLGFKLDCPNKRIEFIGAGSIGLDDVGIGIGVDLNTIVTWDPWTFQSSKAISIGLEELTSGLLSIDLLNTSYYFDWEDRRINFTGNLPKLELKTYTTLILDQENYILMCTINTMFSILSSMAGDNLIMLV